jgi:hypothetical protein
MGFARDVADETQPQQPETQRFLRRLLDAGRL